MAGKFPAKQKAADGPGKKFVPKSPGVGGGKGFKIVPPKIGK